MRSMDARQAEQQFEKSERLQTSRNELIVRINRLVQSDDAINAAEGLWLRRVSTPTELGHSVSFPCFCVIAQGSKEVWLADQRHYYDAAHYLVATANLPIASRVVGATAEKPYLSVILTLDPMVVGSVIAEAGYSAPSNQSGVQAINVSPLDADLLETVVRLVRLVDNPGEFRVLGPLVKREIIYRLLVGAQGSRLRYLSSAGGNTQRMAEAIFRLQKDFDQPLRIEDVARDLGMSVSSFHHHFKAVTAMSPLQFQKQLRLQEARRLMLGERLDAASAGYRVGYEDASHFSREYKRLFGEPPLRDIGRLQTGANEPVGP